MLLINKILRSLLIFYPMKVYDKNFYELKKFLLSVLSKNQSVGGNYHADKLQLMMFAFLLMLRFSHRKIYQKK